MKIYLPENLDLAEVIIIHPPLGIPKFTKNKLAIILSQIYSSRATSHKTHDEQHGFIPLRAAILQSLVREYRLYLDYGVKAGIILEKGHFIRHKKCRHFKFAPAYQTKILEYVDSETNIPLVLKKKTYNQILLPKSYGFLAKHLSGGHLQLDYKNAVELMQRRLEYYLENPDRYPVNRWTGGRRNPVEQFNNAIYCIEKIKNQDYFANVDQSSGRLHTSITNLPKLLRHFITYSGESLVTVDVSNCQPYLINSLTDLPFYLAGVKNLSQNFFGSYFSLKFEELEEKRSNKDITFNINKVNKEIAGMLLSREDTTLSLVTLVNWAQTHASSELQWFWNATTSGQYYEYLQYHLTKDIDSRFCDKSTVKVESLRILFTSNKYIYHPDAEAERWFLENVKGISDIAWFLKSIDKSLFPILLQSMEAEIMLDRVARRINRERPELPIFPIHDCLATTVGNEMYVARIMREEFCACIGAPPQLKIEYYGPGNKKILGLPY
jgi:hypothetical protein